MKLKRLEKMRTGGTRTKMPLSIPMPKTPYGRAYRYSPNTMLTPGILYSATLSSDSLRIRTGPSG